MPAWQNIYGQSPSHTMYMATRSKVNAVAYEKRVLKLQQWRQPKRQWVLKSPNLLNYLPDVLEVYPDIQLVWMHRDPIVAMASAVNLVGTLAWSRSDRILPAGTFGAVADPVSASNMLTKPIDWIEGGLIAKERVHSTQMRISWLTRWRSCGGFISLPGGSLGRPGGGGCRRILTRIAHGTALAPVCDGRGGDDCGGAQGVPAVSGILWRAERDLKPHRQFKVGLVACSRGARG